MDLEIVGEVWYWRGPSPYHFVTVPDAASAQIEAAAGLVSYGWVMIPVACTVGRTRLTTSLWPKDDLYVVPLKVAVRRAEALDLGDIVTVGLHLDA